MITRIILILFFILNVYCQSVELWVAASNNTSNNCDATCGTASCPCIGLNTTVELVNSNYNNFTNITLTLLPGYYQGQENSNITISVPLKIR